MLFGKNKKIKELEAVIVSLRNELTALRRQPKPSMADLMRESLGILVDFSSVDDNGLPPHYLKGLNEDEHRNFIIDAERVYENKSYQAVARYMVNLFGTAAIYKEDKDQMKYGQVAVVAFNNLRKQFEDMHKEFLLLNQKKEEFDPLAVLPE